MRGYAASGASFDEMSGRLGYESFRTLDLGYTSTCYMARFPFPHGYVGVRPARTGEKLRHADRATGIPERRSPARKEALRAPPPRRR